MTIEEFTATREPATRNDDETPQLSFTGDGVVIVQPFEEGA